MIEDLSLYLWMSKMIREGKSLKGVVISHWFYMKHVFLGRRREEGRERRYKVKESKEVRKSAKSFGNLIL